MKKLYFLFYLLTSSFLLFAQAPQGIPYQAIARNASGVAIANTAVKVRFSIRDSIATGAIKYQETHNPTTSTLGLFSVNVGMGTAGSGTFSGINWGKNAKFLQVEMDPAGGENYTDLGTTQMLSVPYALYAENSGSNPVTPKSLPNPSMYSSPSTNTVYFFDALAYCYNLNENGYTDWRVPSLEEVAYMRDIVGVFITEDYWTKNIDYLLGTGTKYSMNFTTKYNQTIIAGNGYYNNAGYVDNTKIPAICVR